MGLFDSLSNSSHMLDDYTTNTFFHGVVVDIDDPEEHGRVKVRILSQDSSVLDEDIKWCTSLNVSCIFMLPMIGEHVVVFLRNPWTKRDGRFYIGPIRSGDTAHFESMSDTINKLEIGKYGL